MIEKLVENPNSAGLGWLLEMELVNNPHVLNAIIANIFRAVSGIKDADFVIDTKAKKLLIYLELGYFAKIFYKRRIETQVSEMFEQTLPHFKKRVVFDKKILNRALNIVKNQGIQTVKVPENDQKSN